MVAKEFSWLLSIQSMKTTKNVIVMLLTTFPIKKYMVAKDFIMVAKDHDFWPWPHFIRKVKLNIFVIQSFFLSITIIEILEKNLYFGPKK